MSSYDERIEVKKSLDNIWKMKISELYHVYLDAESLEATRRNWTHRNMNIEILFNAPDADTEDLTS